MTQRFANKVAIVTGAASGIGREITLGLLHDGAAVVANDLTEAALRALEGDEKLTRRAGDIADPDTAKKLVTVAMREHGRIDMVVNNAGVAHAGPAERLTDHEWQHSIDVNLTGSYYLAREGGRQMIQQRSGVVLNVASMAGLSGVPENAAYVAAKHGVVGLTRGLATEWARYGIRVNALCPGLTETQIVADLEAQAPEMMAGRRRRIPIGRTARPVEQANVALFLLSDDASYVSGLIANVDAGGFALYSGYALPEASDTLDAPDTLGSLDVQAKGA